MFWGLTNPQINASALSGYLSKESRTRLVSKVNQSAAIETVNNKALFYELCESAKITIPRTYGVYGAQVNNSTSKASAISCRTLDDGSYVGKPTHGSNGIGLVFFKKISGTYVFGHLTMSEDEAHAFLLDQSHTNALVIQDWVEPHPDLMKISLSRGVQSVRVVTFLENNGQVHILFSKFKFICNNNLTDNFTHGESGNLIADVDTKTGEITAAWTKPQDEIGIREIDVHPNSQESLHIILPYWREIVDIAVASAKTFPTLRCLAWDIAISPTGPVVLEANVNWEIFPTSPYNRPTSTSDWDSLVY